MKKHESSNHFYTDVYSYYSFPPKNRSGHAHEDYQYWFLASVNVGLEAEMVENVILYRDTL